MIVELAQEGPVVALTLNRPEARNALSIELCTTIVDALEEIDATEEARVVVIKGAGSVFCSGADFAAVSGPSGLDFLPAFERMLDAIARHRLPTIARIHGAALGGGLQLAGVCDFRIAASDAQLGIPSARLGIVVNFENVKRLVGLTGIARAKEVLMTARTYTGQEAVAAGLVTRSVEPAALDGEVARLAQEIAALAPLSVQGSKRAIQAVADYWAATPSEADGAIAELVTGAYNSEDLSEGLTALSEKRPPHFRGA